ncbi:hypothetical protein HPO96_28620 [Kribbella sandramycini]|uniref:Uncharacterized protein n=1 Tax=Kribbella sandramycini TaxID=60450 RepID=A0A7Y4L4M7_9ACTN|nr:hypothetical protein [Kribbella sandramycini]MBB6571572.1 hypothetical protein [Kribbella sandramycini]NOL44218.1 hypothetical protein [Kribbella sandramycini]
MSHPMEHRAITANQARSEYVAKCNEAVEIEQVLNYLENKLVCGLQAAEPVVNDHYEVSAVYASDAFWQLLDLYRDAENRRRDIYAARDYAHAVWVSASAGTSIH